MSGAEITWWGHSTASVEVGGARLLTDPVVTDRLAHLRRLAPSVREEEVLTADLVVVSHLHPDHFHVPTLRRLTRGTPVLVPRGGGRLLRGAGLDVDEVGPGDTGSVAGIAVRATPAVHPHRRHVASRLSGEPLGFVIRQGGTSVWYPGDTELSDHVDDVGEVDVALVPIGGWGPTLGAGHMGPVDAAEAVRRVGARWAVPVHWGTFWPLGVRRGGRVYERLFRTPGERFAEAVRTAQVRIPAHGATTRVEVAGG